MTFKQRLKASRIARVQAQMARERRKWRSRVSGNPNTKVTMPFKQRLEASRLERTQAQIRKDLTYSAFKLQLAANRWAHAQLQIARKRSNWPTFAAVTVAIVNLAESLHDSLDEMGGLAADW